MVICSPVGWPLANKKKGENMTKRISPTAAAFIVFAVISLFVAVPLAFGPPAKAPAIPDGTGYCVTVVDRDDTVLGIVNVPFHKPDSRNLDEFKASLRNAVTLVARTTNRQDILDLIPTLDLIDNPIPPLHGPRPPRHNPNGLSRLTTSLDQIRKNPGGGGVCTLVCVCATPIYGDEVGPAIQSADPVATGSKIIGCGGACGPCEKCKVSC